MKLAIPSETDEKLDAMRSGHFGHTPYFTIVEIDDGEIKSVESIKNVDHDTAGCGGVIDFVISLGVDGIMTVGMGRPPLMRFSDAGIIVYSERENAIVGGALRKFMNGNVDVMSIDDACNHH